LITGDAFTSTYLPVAVGAVVAAVGSVLFIIRSHAFREVGQGDQTMATNQRRLAVRMVLVLYGIIAGICFVVAIVIGELAFIVLTGLILLLAIAGLGRSWSLPR
jgi:hypothetical protein